MTSREPEPAPDGYRPCGVCGYDLRGLGPPPVRCPECGTVWSPEDRRGPPLAEQRRRRRRDRRACRWLLGGVGLLVLGATQFGLMVWQAPVLVTLLIGVAATWPPWPTKLETEN